jgi:NADPH:quinone reductase-like Zn-dependent oxidoreductase
VQFAKRRGARVLATAHDADGAELLRRLGADAAADTQHDDLVAAARAFAPDGVDAILAFAAGPALAHAVATLREGGTIAYPHGVELPDGLTATAFDGVPNAAAFARLNAIVDEAPLQVPITAIYSLDDAAEAHRRLERGHVHGKIVLVVDATEDVLEDVA